MNPGTIVAAISIGVSVGVIVTSIVVAVLGHRATDAAIRRIDARLNRTEGDAE